MGTFEIIMYFILPAIVLLIIVTVPLLKRRKPKKEIASDETLNTIYEAFGEKDNILSIRRTQDRINFTVKDVKQIKNNVLKELNISAFLKQNEVTILFKNGSKNLYDYVKTKLKE